MNKEQKKWGVVAAIVLYSATFLYIKTDGFVPAYAGKINECTVNHEEETRKEIDELNKLQKQIAEKHSGVRASIQGYTYKCDACGYVGLSI